MGRPSKGLFTPKNTQKYLGKNLNKITYKSSWELTCCLFFDNNPSVLGWMSESIPSNHVHEGISGIPYRNPFTGRWTIYVPDFFVIYVDKHRKQHAEVMEIKPLQEVPPAMSGVGVRVSKLTEAKQILNAAKYAAAIAFCSQRGWYFRVVTEKDLFAWAKPR